MKKKVMQNRGGSTPVPTQGSASGRGAGSLTEAQTAGIGELARLFSVLPECKALTKEQGRALSLIIVARLQALAKDPELVIRDVPGDVLELLMQIDTGELDD